MRFTEAVNVPNELVDALETGDLVFFVGAGASVSAPANLPNFYKLAEQVADQVNYRRPCEKEPLDAFFGDLEREGVPVNQLVAENLEAPDSQPNRVHKAIVRLAVASNAPKIITTNFDSLIQRAWSERTENYEQFVGPAVPLGDDFTGLVQLHGSIESPSCSLVLTERSFGAAYLTRGWATRFLVDVFERYTVVFVGYSHRDPVMRYLATALSRASKRYAFIGTDDASDSADIAYLKLLGVEPIPFPRENDHAALPDVLEEWARYAENDWLDTRNRLHETLISIENVTPQDEDFLERYLNAERGLEHFGSACVCLPLERQQAVLDWLRKHTFFKALFDRKIQFDGKTESLTRWLANYYLSSAQTLNDLWSDFETFGIAIRKHFYNDLEIAAYRALWRGQEWADLLIKFLHTSIPGISAPERSEALPFELTVKRKTSIPEVTRLLHSRMEPYKPFNPNEETHYSFRLRWGTKGYRLHSVLKSEEPDPQSAVFGAIERSLIDAYELNEAFNPDSETDPVGGGWLLDMENLDARASDTITVMGRYMARACCTGRVTEEQRLRWWNSQRPIFCRFSLIALKHDTKVEPQSKILWLLGNVKNLYSGTTRSEALSLLAQFIGAVPADLQDRVMERIHADATSPLDIYRAFHVLSSGPEGWPAAEEQIDRLEGENHIVQEEVLRYSEYQERQNQIQNPAPLRSVDGLDQYLDQFPSDAWTAHSNLVSGLAAFLEKNRSSSISLALKAADSSHENADAALRVAIDSIRPEQAIEASSEFLELCRSAPKLNVTGLALILSKSSNQAETGEVQDNFTEAVEVLWRQNIEGLDHNDLDANPDILQWPELLVEALSGLAFAKWKFTDEELAETASWFSDQIKSRLQDSRLKPLVARSLGRRLGFICQLDEALVTSTVMPLFCDKGTEKFAWTGFLQNPQLSRTEPMKGIVKRLLELGWQHTVDDDILRHRFFEVVAVSLESELYGPEETQSILDNGVATLGDSNRASFIQFLGMRLGGEAGQALWNNGIKKFVMRRLQSQPRNVGNRELRALSDLPFESPSFVFTVIPELTSLVENEKLPLSEVPPNLLLKSWTSDDVERIAPYLHLRIRNAGFVANAEHAWLDALEQIDNPGPRTSELIAKLRASD